MTCPLHITSHALIRFRERFDWAKPYSNRTLALLLQHMTRQGMQFGGGQFRGDELRLSSPRDHCGPVVIVLATNAECQVIRTVLTSDMALANISRHRAMRVRSPQKKRRRRKFRRGESRFEFLTRDYIKGSDALSADELRRFERQVAHARRERLWWLKNED